MGSLFGGGSSTPPAPDPRIGRAAKEQARLGREYLEFSKEQFAVSTEMQRELNEIAKRVSDHFLSLSEADRERWETVFKPLEDQFIADAKDWDSPERLAEAAAGARADVQSAAAAERGATERRMASMGVSPESGRFAGMDRALGLGTALASVGAQNEARDQRRSQALGLRGAAIDLGRGLPASSAAAMTSSLGAAAVPFENHMRSTGIVQPGFNAAMQGQQGMANTLLGQHQAQMSAWQGQQNMNAANAQGFGQFAGTALGLILSSKKTKQNRKKLEEGTALAAVEQMPVEEFDYKPGMGDGGHHVGPMAEDFAAATGQGDGTAIPVQDALGLTMGAVRDLSRKVDKIADTVGLGLTRPKTA